MFIYLLGLTRQRCSYLMAHQPNTKSPLHFLHAFSVKNISPISSPSPKIRTLVQTYILRNVCHLVRAIAYAKTMAIDLLNKEGKYSIDHKYSIKLRRRKRKKLLASIRPCCIWSSSHVIPVSEPHSMEGFDPYYDSSWNSIIPTEEGNDDTETKLSGYLRWLEEKDPDGSATDIDGIDIDIDRLAEKFIENCHEKFRLEKQESYRRYQEMLARSM